MRELRRRLRAWPWSGTLAGLVAVLVIALGARVAVLQLASEVPIQSDSLLYDSIAKTLAGFSGVNADQSYHAIFYRGFGYPSLLSLGYRVTLSYTPIRVMQAVAWAVSAGLVYAVAARLAGPRRALAASLLVTLQPTLLKYFLFLLAEGLLVLLVTASVAVLVLVVPRRPQLGAGLYAALLGVLAVSHSAWQFYPLVGLLPLLAVAGARRLLLGATVTVVTMLAVLIPFHVARPGNPWLQGRGGTSFGGGGAWTAYVGSNVSHDGRPRPVDYALAEGNLSFVRGVQGQGQLDSAIAPQIPRTGSKRLPDGAFWQATIDHVTDDPLGEASLTAKKVWRQLTAAKDPYPVRAHELGGVLDATARPLAIVLVLGGAAGLLVMLRDGRRRLFFALAVPVLYSVLVFAAVGVPEFRYAMPALHVLAIALAYAIAPLRLRAGVLPFDPA